MNSKLKRILCFVLALLTVLSMALPTLAITTTITDEDIPYDFFEYSKDGSWHDLNTPVHRDASGNYAYCIEHMKDPPSNSTQYTDFNAASVFSSTTITGIQAILDHGYPVSTGGLSGSKAHYATANAIRFWIKESAGIGYNFMDPNDPSKVRAKSDSADCWALCMQLLQYARSGATTGGSDGGRVYVSPSQPTWQLGNGQLVTQLGVRSSDGYTIQASHPAVQISGYTGGTNDALIITAPVSLMGTDVSLFIQGRGSSGQTASLYWYEPSSSSKQSVVVVELTAGGTPDSGYVTITGEFYDLTVKKVDSYTGAALDGAVFQLTSDGDAVGLTQTGAGTYTASGNTTQFTTSNGTAVITGLPGGSYQLVEVSAPSAAYTASAAGGINLTRNASVTVQNAPTEINISKTDKTTGAAMENITFTLLDSAGNAVKLSKAADGTYRPDSNGSTAILTDAAGKAKIMYLPKDKYTLCEDVPAGYAPQADATLNLTGKSTVNITNEPLTLTLTKVDSFTGKTLAGIAFTLLDSTGAAVKLTKQSDGVYHYDTDGTAGFITGADGRATIYFIPAGNYILRETTETATGYAAAKDVPVAVTNSNGSDSPATVRFQNDPITLEFNKSDALTKEPLDGGVFQLKDESGAIVKLKQIETGSYRPDSSGEAIFTTKNGEAVIRYLPPQKYEIFEVIPPKGYKADSAKTVTVTAANDVSNAAKAGMQDQPLAIEFTKIDALTGKAIDGGTFTLLDKGGDAVNLRKVSDGVYTSDADGAESFTTCEGKAIIGPIDPGTYTIHESKSPSGMATAADVAVTVTDANVSANAAKATLSNSPITLSVAKIDGDTELPIGGQVFKVLDEDGNVIKLSPISGKLGWFAAGGVSETFVMPSSGTVNIAYLPAGEYELCEVTPLDGYATPEEAAAFAVSNDDVYTAPKELKIENKALMVEVTKTDGLTGKALSGVPLEIFNADGIAVKTKKLSDGAYAVDKNGSAIFQTGENGKASIRLLPEGEYTLAELDNPGFGKVEPVKFTVGNGNTSETPTVVGLINFPLELIVTKIDAESKEPLAGVSFKLSAKDAGLKFTKQEDGSYIVSDTGVDTFETDEAGKARILYVPAGTLTLTEQEYRGYSIADPKDIAVTDANTLENPATVTIENKPLAFSLLKQDGASGAPLEGVTFKLFAKDGKAVSLALLSDGTYRPADTVKHLPKATDIKADSDGKVPLSVVKTTDTLITDTQGKAVVEFISQGKYRLEEQQQVGYVVLEGLEFEITSAHTREHPMQYTVSNVPTRLLIEKQCGVTKELLTGATFQLLDKDGKAVKLVQQKDGTYQPAKANETGVDTFPVNDKGQVVICYLPVGTFTVKEVTGPTGYAISAPIATEVGTEAVLVTSQGAKKPATDTNKDEKKDDEQSKATENAEATGKTDKKNPAIPTDLLHDSKGNYLAETSLAVVDLPLALKISKVHAKTQKPLMGAAFQLKAADKLTTSLTFTVKNGVYWYDAKGNVTTIEMDKNAEALVYGLPVGKYVLEETVVPTNFFPAVPQNIEIAMMNTSEAPKEVVVVNTPTVKLGIDSDKFNVVIAIALTILIGGGLAAYTIIRRKRK
jgi:uncharacterized surface anchored protein